MKVPRMNKEDALRLLDDGPPFASNTQKAYRKLKLSQKTSEMRLLDLAGILLQGLDTELGLNSSPVAVLTEGCLCGSVAILNEFRSHPPHHSDA